ncbi:DoxX family membrane protein [Streptomyces sp. DSM 44917]|uniref:DoxX family membrane protein n=1 Tax=Streptomyces boetiae TaxID=3075541 RepID=A0ABU2L800_9ACTN|nr:DoxX family membrane protein [Streptomyces sp. DSM 44917]MDT0307423.1 DoxX family membrane protein [Streptomyces sp. DSM 44917]
MDVLVLIGRILFVALFLNSALGHLTQTKAMEGYAASKGVPSPKAGVLGSGVLMLLGGLMLLLGVWPDLGALLLFLMLLPTALLMHAFWKESDPAARQGEQIHFLKDLALAGAALMLFALMAIAGDDLGLTWTGPLFGRDDD